MSNESPPVFNASPPEIPLDLTLRRPETDNGDMNNLPYPRTIVRQMSSPSNLEYHTNAQYTQCNSQYATDRNESFTGVGTPSPPATSSNQSLSPPTNAYRSTSRSPIPYLENGLNADSAVFDSSILPKKRKNLWRPYDSRLAACSEVDRDSDSSDSTASVSDQEFKTPAMDPVKKRKMNMIHYTSNDPNKHTSDNNKCRIEEAEQSSDNESSQANGNSQSSPEKYDGPWNMSQSNEPTSGYFTNMAEELTKSQLSLLNSYPESREKMISGMKKRDIFGWGLKLTKPSTGNQQISAPPTTGPNSSQDKPTQNVCQDGEKTYIELQTVRSNTSPQPIQNEGRVPENPTAEKSPFKVPKIDVPKSNERSPTAVQSKTIAMVKTSAASYESEKANVNANADGKVYIQTRDNVIQSFDESKNVPVKTKKGISLIDLVEEIEATAKRLEDDDETRNKRNRQVTALLEQCNHVKLQALDFLMANVLIQDREPQYKQKNEKVQKMLKGDKIGSVNMLDVLELQVEIGLN